MNSIAKVLLICIALGFLCLGFVGCSIYGGYNKAVALDEGVKAAWAQVENQLQRRFDLIPNLVEVVKGVATQEKEIFVRIAEARQGYFQASTQSEKVQSARVLTAAMGGLLGLRESYPELKSNQSFMKLHDDVGGTENRIGVARKRYNEAVQQLNTYTRKLIGRFCSGLAGVGPAEFFKIDEAARDAPAVDFSGKP